MSTPLPLRGLHHLSLQTSDVDQVAAFYTNVLGFAQIPRPNLQFPGAWLFGYGIQIHLIGGQGFLPTSRQISSREDHVAFHADDLEQIARLLQEHSVPYRVNIQTHSGLKQIFFHDPDGHTIEVATYPAPPAPEKSP